MFYVSLPKKYYQTADRDFIRRALWGGTTFKLVGAWPVYKGTGDLNKALVHHLDILRKGGSITIFPEGGVSKNGTIAPFKVGAPFLVSQTGVTVVPVAITGLSFPLIPEGARRRRVTVEFGAPVQYPADVSPSPESLEATALDMHTRVVSLARRFYPGA
jgi:1-acyl-sn-glycerol-3-phosphate acyltransferase